MITQVPWPARITKALSTRPVHITEPPPAVATVRVSADAPARLSVFPQEHLSKYTRIQ
jgi:hypothetical protein